MKDAKQISSSKCFCCLGVIYIPTSPNTLKIFHNQHYMKEWSKNNL